MKSPPLRPFAGTELRFTPVGLGTWNMERDPASSAEALRAGIEAGANHIDTAEMYGDGRVEEIVGRAVKGLRGRVSIVSKVLPSNASRAGTVAACERSLKRLGVERLETYLLHWRGRTPLEETFSAFEDLRAQGKIRSWGVSNFDVADLEEAVRIAGEGKIACNQVLYHPNERAVEFDLIPWCRWHGIPVVAYSPLGNDRLPQSPVLDEIARARQASPAQVVLAWLTRDPLVFAIPKSSDRGRSAENARAMGIALSDDEIRRLDQAFPARRRKSLPTL